MTIDTDTLAAHYGLNRDDTALCIPDVSQYVTKTDIIKVIASLLNDRNGANNSTLSRVVRGLRDGLGISQKEIDTYRKESHEARYNSREVGGRPAFADPQHVY